MNAKPEEPLGPERRGQCILYVEDDEHEVLLLRHCFEAAGIKHPLHVVGDGNEAMTYLGRAALDGDGGPHPMPRLVLLDLHLPGMSGLEVLEWIRAQPALTNLVVILFTSSDDPQEVACAYRLRVNSFIKKPDDLRGRLEMARLLEGWWLRRNQFPEASPARPKGRERPQPARALADDGDRGLRKGEARG
jgi:CheY-like chemotaxis protein